MLRLEREFSLDALERSGLKRGDVLRHPHTSARYVVDSASAYVPLGWPDSSPPRVVALGHRTYSTGRPDASSTSALDLSLMERER